MTKNCAVCGSTKNLTTKRVTGREGDSVVSICRNCYNREKFPELDKKRRRLMAELDEVVAEMAQMIAEAQTHE